MPSHVLTLTWTRSGEQLTKNITCTAAGEKNLSISLTAAQADKLYEYTLDVSNLKSLYILSTVDAVLETNGTSGTNTADTLTLTANQPIVWYPGMDVPNPFTSGTDVTAIYATNSNTSSSGTIELRSLEDVTS